MNYEELLEKYKDEPAVIALAEKMKEISDKGAMASQLSHIAFTALKEITTMVSHPALADLDADQLRAEIGAITTKAAEACLPLVRHAVTNWHPDLQGRLDKIDAEAAK